MNRGLVVKVLAWRIISILVTLAVMFVYLGDVRSATGVSIFLHFVLTVLNYGYEIMWKRFTRKRE